MIYTSKFYEGYFKFENKNDGINLMLNKNQQRVLNKLITNGHTDN